MLGSCAWLSRSEILNLQRCEVPQPTIQNTGKDFAKISPCNTRDTLADWSPAMITDCHIHIQPMELFKPEALALMKKSRKDFDQVAEYCGSPKAFLKHLDRICIDRAVLINYIAPEVIGFTPAVNEFIANYVKEDPKRLIPCGSVHPRHTQNVLADMEHIVRLGIKLIKIHPPHQLLYPNDYVNGVKE